MNRRIWLFVFVLTAFSLVATGQALAQEPTPGPSLPSDDQVNAVARQLYCPVCENTPLDVCPTQACAEWRSLIREKLAQGWSADQIKTYFAQQYGDRVLAAPPARGLNWLVYVIPPLAFLLGVFLLYRAFKAWRTPQPAQPVPASAAIDPADEDEYEKKIEEELRKL